MKGFTRILVPHDDSPAAGRALQVAGDLLESNGTLVLCRVVDMSGMLSPTTPTFSPESNAPIDVLWREAHDSLAQAARESLARGTSAEIEVVDGHPVDAILAMMRENHADAIVMGSHGRRGLARLVLGSTAEGVLRRSTVPVVVVRDPRESESVGVQSAATPHLAL